MNLTVNVKILVIAGLVISVLAFLAMKEADGPKDFILMKTIETRSWGSAHEKLIISRSDGPIETIKLEELSSRNDGEGWVSNAKVATQKIGELKAMGYELKEIGNGAGSGPGGPVVITTYYFEKD